MKFIKRVVKSLFYRVYDIDVSDFKQDDEISFACDGRIVRSLSESKKQVCGAYVLNGLEKQVH